MRVKIAVKNCATVVAIAGLWMMLACSKKKEEGKDAPKITEPNQVSESPTPMSASNIPLQSSARPANRKAAENMKDILRAISSGGDTVTAIKEGWKVFDHPAFEQPAGAKQFRDLTEGKAPLLLIELRDPASRWNTDPGLKEAVVGRLSLVTALFGSSNSNIAKFPELMRGKSNGTITTEGDMVTLQIVQQAVKSIQTKMPLQDNQLPAWEGLAASQKPTDRAIALVAFNALQPTPEQANRFYSRYLAENDPEVTKIFIEQLATVNTPAAVKMLERLKAQPSAEKFMPTIDAKLLQMNGSNR